VSERERAEDGGQEEGRGQGAEIRGQRSEVSSQKPEVGCQKSEALGIRSLCEGGGSPKSEL